MFFCTEPYGLGRRLQKAEAGMKCLICKTGETKKGTTTVTLEREDTVVVIKDVPAQVCDNCGEYYLSEDVSTRIYTLAEEAVEREVELELLKYTVKVKNRVRNQL